MEEFLIPYLNAKSLLTFYFIGYVSCLIFLIIFGRKVGCAYDKSDSDGYKSNAEGYLTVSIFWFLFIPYMLISGIFKCIVFFVEFLTGERKLPVKSPLIYRTNLPPPQLHHPTISYVKKYFKFGR